MVSFFLMHDAANEPEFKISFWGFSPIEFRLLVIVFNILLYFNTHLVKTLVSKYFVFVNLVLSLFLIIIIHSHQKQLDKNERA